MLKSLKNIGHLQNPDLLSTLVSKLPTTLRTLWLTDKDRRNTSQPILCYLSLWLEEIVINHFKHGNLNNYHPRQNTPFQNKQIYNRPYAPKNNNFDRQYDPSKKFSYHTTNNDIPPCCVCKADHPISHCEKFKNVSTSQRWEIAKHNNICYKCLQHGHSRFKCKLYLKSPNKKFHDLLINHNQVETNEVVTNTWEDN